MKNTLEKWYSLNKLTPEQYYQLIDLISPQTQYTLQELLLLTQLPDTTTYSDPNNELSKFQRERDYWDYESSASDWLDEPPKNFFLTEEFLIPTAGLLLLTIYLLTK